MTNLHVVNAHLAAPGGVVNADAWIRDGLIAGIAPEVGPGGCQRIDFEGDWLLPGLVEMHTDTLEKHLSPRPGVVWPEPLGAVLAHDAQLVAAGITTVFDAVSVGLNDRGDIATGKRADLLRVREVAGVPVVVGVWRQGARIL